MEVFNRMERQSAVVWIGGAAGDGVASTGDILAKTCSRSGLHYFAQSSYQSVIRGGHVVYQFQTGSAPVYTHGDNFDLLIALNQDSVDLHLKSIQPGVGRGIVFNSDKVKLDAALLPAGAVAYGLAGGRPDGRVWPQPGDAKHLGVRGIRLFDGVELGHL
jgi:Pyruvate/2-oxoacid:ferredoxin oxidoreductase gamma subunit